MDCQLVLAAPFFVFAVRLKCLQKTQDGGAHLLEHGVLLLAIGAGWVLHEPVRDAVGTRKVVLALITFHWLPIRRKHLEADSTPDIVG